MRRAQSLIIIAEKKEIIKMHLISIKASLTARFYWQNTIPRKMFLKWKKLRMRRVKQKYNFSLTSRLDYSEQCPPISRNKLSGNL